MDSVSLKSFALRLDRITKAAVNFVTQKTILSGNEIYLLSDNAILLNQNNNNFITIQKNNNNFYHPTIDLLFNSAANLTQIDISAYILSGIGRDGTNGLLSLKKTGHKCTAQDKESSIVYGMPKAALEANAVDSVLSINKISQKIYKELACCPG
jgi:two-component system chemotaxis response regulator CheB